MVVIPLTFSVLGGFRTNQQLVEKPVGFPNPWVGVNYTSILRSASFWRQVRNSTVIALLTATIVLPAASLAAYVIARYPFKGREVVYGLFTLGLLFPVAVAILPLFIMLRQVGLLSNPLGVALPQAAFGLPIAIIVMRPFFRAIPTELQDAAAIDGCGPFRFYWSVMLPLSRPVLEHDRDHHDRRELERVLPAVARAHRPEPAHAADRGEQHLGAVLDGLRQGARLHHARDGAGTAVLRRWPNARSSAASRPAPSRNDPDLPPSAPEGPHGHH